MSILNEITQVLVDRKSAEADVSYVASLYAEGTNKILEKVGEEATEVIIAAKESDRGEVVKEVADLWFHSMVLLVHLDLTPQEVLDELARRFGVSGHVEKAGRKK